MKSIPIYAERSGYADASAYADASGCADASGDIRLHEIDLYVTMKCNLDCDFCSVSANDYDHDDLPLGRILEVIEEAAGLGLKELHISGGEPTLRHDLEDMIEFAKRLDLHTRIITNGFKLPRARLQRLRDCGLDDIMVSIDGLEATHNRMRSNRFSYQRAKKVVEDAVDIGLNTRVSTVVYRDNTEDVIPLLRWSDEIGANIFSAFLGSPLGRGARFRKDKILTAQEWQNFCETIHAVAQDGTRLSVILEQGFQYADGPLPDRSSIKGRGTGCATLMDSYDFLIVRSDGNLYQCVFFVFEGRPIGNVAQASLETALRDARKAAIYKKFTEPRGACVTCNEQSSCGGGCPGYSYLYTGDWLNTDPRCAKTGDEPAPAYPLCPILKLNARSRRLGGSTEQAVERETT